jgi:hypothetical protein
MKRTSFFPFVWFSQIVSPLTFPFGLPYDVPSHRSFIGFLWLLYNESKYNILLALVGKANKIEKEDIILLLSQSELNWRMNECTLGTWLTKLHTLQKKLSFLYRSWISIKTDNYTGDLLKSFV